ncbi:response regulator [Pontibacter qinzhouensis]|nr:response regulator [Pontibacter qinzhouensis]
MKFIASAFRSPVQVGSFIRRPWFKQESERTNSTPTQGALDLTQCFMDVSKLNMPQTKGAGTKAGAGKQGFMSYLGGSVLQKIDTFAFVNHNAKEQAGRHLANDRKRRKQAAPVTAHKGHIAAHQEALHTSVLLQETEQLAQIGSWEYIPAAKNFVCSNYIYQLLNIPQGKKLSNFFSLLPYISADCRATIQESWNKLLLEGGNEMNHEVQLAGSQGSVWIRLKARSIKVGSKLIRIAGIMQDITESKKYEKQLLAAKEKAEQANKVKSEFVSVLSHEIRTPLNAIMGLTHLLLQEESIVDNNKSNLESIHFSSQNMLGLINNTLDFSRIEAGKLELEKINFNLKDLLRDIHRSLLPKALEKNLTFDLTFDLNTPAEVAGDPTKLTQILNNLVCNAIKFTNKGKVNLAVDVVYQSNQDWVLEFKVNDTGMGIPEDRQQLIFESYTQASTAINRQYGGTGLGLSITKKLVDLHKGSIKLTSTPGKGAEFSVYLKFTKPQTSFAAPKGKTAAETQHAGLKGTKILVIDDNPFNQMVATQLLTSWQAEVETANDGVEAVNKIKATSYDLVLMDLYMPLMDGFEAISEIRGRGYQMPIVALTANSSEEEQNRVMALGGNDYLTKPFIPQVLYNKLVKQINDLRVLQ